jgi:hypothetical protein
MRFVQLMIRLKPQEGGSGDDFACQSVYSGRNLVPVMAVYDPLLALLKLRAMVRNDVETIASTLSADKRTASTFVAFDANVRPGFNVAIQNYYIDHRDEGMTQDQAARDVERQRAELAKQKRVFMIMMHLSNDLLMLYMRDLGGQDLDALEDWLDIAPPMNHVKLLLVAGTKMLLLHVPMASTVMRH